MNKKRKYIEREAVLKAGFRETDRASKVIVGLVAASWMFVEAQRFRGEGPEGELMGAGCG